LRLDELSVANVDEKLAAAPVVGSADAVKYLLRDLYLRRSLIGSSKYSMYKRSGFSAFQHRRCYANCCRASGEL
jgi:hypothetical protein